MDMIIFDDRLYPFAMLKDMPKGLPFRINGHYDFDKDTFGFCKVRVIAPKLNIMFLPYKQDFNTIVPTGTWEGWYFSEELKYAQTLGYKIIPLN